MTARPRHLRLAAPATAARLELVPALAAPGRRQEMRGVVAPGRGDAIVHDLRLPGIGGRYLVGIDAHIEAAGWSPAERAALLQAFEARAVMWIHAAPAAALRRAGLVPLRRTARGTAAIRYASGRWTAAAMPAAAGVAEIAAAAHARGAMSALAVSGAARSDTLLAAARDAGARTAAMPAGLAAAIGARWAVELLVAPALPPGSLVGLRERVATAAPCDWCGVPVLGTVCGRCSPPSG
jgi:hypothetical protein